MIDSYDRTEMLTNLNAALERLEPTFTRFVKLNPEANRAAFKNKKDSTRARRRAFKGIA